VFSSLTETYRRLLVRWVEAVCRRASIVALASLLATVGAGYYFTANIAINTDVSDMLSPELEFRKLSRALSEAFPQFSDNILVVIDGQTPDLAQDGADALREKLVSEPGLFGDVYDPAGDPFFRRNGLLYLETDELADLGDRLAEAQPFLGKLWRDPSLRGLAGMLELAITESLKGKDAIRIEPVLDAMAETARAQAKGTFHTLSWHDLMLEDPAGKEGGDTRRLLLIQPALNFGTLAPAEAAMSRLRQIARELKMDPDHGLRVRLTGSAALSHEEFQSVEQGMGLAGVLSLVLVLGLLLGCFRSARMVIATLITLIMGLIWTAAFAIAAVGQLNLISVAFAVLFIGLSVDFGIHFGLRYLEEADGGADHARALARAASGVGLGLGLAAVAAAIAFYSFWPTDYLGLAELGLIAGTGMFIAFFANLTVLPAFLTLMPPRPNANRFAAAGRAGRMRSRILKGVQSNARPVLLAAALAGIGGLVLLPQARFDFDPLNLKDRNTESAATLFDLMDDPRTSPHTITILAADLGRAKLLAASLEKLAPVEEAETLSGYVPGEQDEKLELIETMGLFLAPSLSATDRARSPTHAQNRAAMASLTSMLQRLAAASQTPNANEAADSARRLLAALSALGDKEFTVSELQNRMLAGLDGRLERLRDALLAEPVTLDSLPKAIRDRQVTADGRARITVYPKEDMRDRAALVRFVTAVRKAAPLATGSSVVMLEAGNAVLRAFREAAVLALVAISLLLVLSLRSVSDTAQIFAILVLAVVLTAASTVVAGIAFNFANVIVLPLLFGLGVAGGIHLVLRNREAAGASDGGPGGGPGGGLGGGLGGTSTPRAVAFSALTTIGSFGSIALSSHPGTSSMGVLLTLSITLTLGCTLLVLPAWLATSRRSNP